MKLTTLKLAILYSGKTQLQISSETGIPQPTLNMIVNGHRKANREQASLIADALDHSRSELFDSFPAKEGARKVMEKHLGRTLSHNEYVHHVDGNRKNNDLTNLKIVSPGEHCEIHVEQQTPCDGITKATWPTNNRKCKNYGKHEYNGKHYCRWHLPKLK